MSDLNDYDMNPCTRTIEQQNAELTAGFLWRAMKYIIERRPHEFATIAILNEKAYDVLDAVEGVVRAKQIN
jgi:hypothetical protein